jgi:hypothetical protein
MNAKSGKKANSVRLPIDLQNVLESIAHRNSLAVNDVIRLCLLKVLPIVEKEGITIKPGKAT